MLEHRLGEVGQGVTFLLNAGLGNGQQACGSESASLAAISKNDFAQLDDDAQGLFGAVVGWLDAFVIEKAKEPVGVLAECPRHVGDIAIFTIPPFFRHAPKSASKPLRPLLELGPIDRPIPELPPQTEHSGAERQGISRAKRSCFQCPL